MKRELWLDLEDTIVTPIVNGWQDFEIINLEKIQSIIHDFEPHVISIFSFAIWDEHQRGLFARWCQPILEKELNVKFSQIPTVDDSIIPVCCKQMGLSTQTVDFQEMSNFWGKQGAFRLFAKHLCESHHMHHPTESIIHLLLDDVVFDEDVIMPRVNATIQQRNIDQFHSV